MDTLTLVCWLQGTTLDTRFVVEISRSKTVYGLKKAIKNKNPVAFRDVDANALALYQPKDLLEPSEEYLSNFVLSKHGKLLKGLGELSQIFPQPPPKGHIHIIVEAPLIRIICWLRETALDARFQVEILRSKTVYGLKEVIKNEKPVAFRDVDANDIRLFKISRDDDELRESLNKMGHGEPLQGDALAPNFLDAAVLEPLRVVIEASTSSPILAQRRLRQVPIGRSRDLETYEHIFLQVESWGEFQESDLDNNWIVTTENVPDFVKTFEEKLVRKPHISSDLHGWDVLDTLSTYFERSGGSIAKDEPQEEVRYAKLSEVAHNAYIVSFKWEKCWKSHGPHKHPLQERDMDIVFFGPLSIIKDATATVLRGDDWPITVVVKCEGDAELRQFCPRSDLLISNSSLPRLLVEVNSTSGNSPHKDPFWMLMTGAFIVRFANNFVSTFKQAKNFVLCAIYIADNGTAWRHTLFQKPDDQRVYCKKQDLSLNSSEGRAEFARYLYNLLYMKSDGDQDMAAKIAIWTLKNKIKDCHLKSFYIEDLNPKDTDHDSRECSRTDDGDSETQSEGGGHDHAQLRANGYEVKPTVMVDDSGGKWESLSKTPEHILTVYRPMKPNEEFIAKKVRKGSNELEIFEFLDSIPLKSDHVVSLVDSFDEWAILPKMVAVKDYVDFRAIPRAFESRLSQVCLGLIKGVGYLHEHRIAHRDIKPDNVVVDKNLNSKIIDFDIAMRVEDEDEEVDAWCGTRGWMAPEVERKLRHSPIRADRWGCGRVILFLLDRFGKEDESLRVFARNLVADDPKQRPSLLEWGRYSAVASSGAGYTGNSDSRKASRPRPDRVEADGEDVKPPKVKKQKPV